MEKQITTHFQSGNLPIPEQFQRSLGPQEGSEVTLRVEGAELVARLTPGNALNNEDAGGTHRAAARHHLSGPKPVR